MYKGLFVLALASSCFLTVTVDSTPIVCDELLRIFDDKSSKRGTLGRIRNAINRACTALDLLRHGINPLDLLTANDDVTKRTRRTKKSSTTTSTTAIPPPVASDQAFMGVAGPDTIGFPAGSGSGSIGGGGGSTSQPLEVILKHPQVNIILGGSSSNQSAGSEASSVKATSVYAGGKANPMETRVAVDAPRHLLPLDFNPHELKRPYPAVYEVKTKFSCEQQPHNPGVYADMSLGCKVFHLCASTDPYHNRTSFYCPDSLLFNQELLRCDYPRKVDCHESYKQFAINENFNKKFDIKYVVLGKVN